MRAGMFSIKFKGESIPAHYITDAATAEYTLNKILKAAETQERESHVPATYAIDTETMALPKYKHIPDAALNPYYSQVRLIQLYDGWEVYVFDILKIGYDELFKPLLEGICFIGHNSIFDLQYFYRQFGVKYMNIGCTCIAARLVSHATTTEKTHVDSSLKALTDVLLGEDILKSMQLSDWSVPELTYEQLEYAGLDAVCTYEVGVQLATKLQTLQLLTVYQLYKKAQHPIVKMQLNGMKLDVEKYRNLLDEWRATVGLMRREITKITKMQVINPNTMADFLERNLDPETLALWPRSETGKLQTDSHAFADFSYLEIVKPFSAFQKATKLCTAFGKVLIDSINKETGRLHCKYTLAGARTGRLSCSAPNLQQCPRDPKIRDCYIAEEGRHIVCADFSQIELRVAAELSGDPVMLHAYKTGIDLHMMTASRVAGKTLDEMNQLPKEESKRLRQHAKSLNFGLLFGLGAKKFSHYAKKSYGVEVSQEEATRAIKIFRNTYSGYRRWQLAQAEQAGAHYYTTTACGKLRKLDKDNCYGPSMNTPVQGSAAECMLAALVILDKDLDPECEKLIACVHDEILVESCDPEQTKRKLEKAMTQGFLTVFPKGITLGLADAHYGKSWAEAKK